MVEVIVGIEAVSWTPLGVEWSFVPTPDWVQKDEKLYEQIEEILDKLWTRRCDYGGD